MNIKLRNGAILIHHVSRTPSRTISTLRLFSPPKPPASESARRLEEIRRGERVVPFDNWYQLSPPAMTALCTVLV